MSSRYQRKRTTYVAPLEVWEQIGEAMQAGAERGDFIHTLGRDICSLSEGDGRVFLDPREIFEVRNYARALGVNEQIKEA